MVNCEKPRQTTLNTTLRDGLNALRSGFLPFPPTVDSSMKNDGCMSFLFHFDLCLSALVMFLKGIFLGVSKGKQASKCKRKRNGPSKTGQEVKSLL